MPINFALLTACQNNDRLAQATFYDFYKRKMLGVCRRYARTQPDAEDILQEAFIKIFKHIKQVRQPDAVHGWVRSIVVNTAIDFYKQNLKYSNQVDYEDALEKNDESFSLIYANLQVEELLAIINQLPDGYRVVINMYAIDGYTHAEIGKILGISEGTSKSQLWRAKEILRNKFNEKKLLENAQ